MEKGRHRQTKLLPREDRLSSHCSQGGVETELHFLTDRTDYPSLTALWAQRQSYTSSQRGQPALTLQSGRGRDRATLPHREDRLSSHCSQGGVETELHFLTEDRLSSHCSQGGVETELHFLTTCGNYQDVRDNYYPKITRICPEFDLKFETLFIRLKINQEQQITPQLATNRGQPVNIFE